MRRFSVFGGHRGIIAVVDTDPVLLDINTLPRPPPSSSTVWTGRGRRCLGGVWVMGGRCIHCCGQAP